mgnify:CR=1 FL=1
MVIDPNRGHKFGSSFATTLYVDALKFRNIDSFAKYDKELMGLQSN